MSNSLAAGSSSSTLGIVLPGVESGSLAAGTSSIERPAIALQYLGSSPPPFNPTRYDEHSLPARSFKTWLQLLKSLFPSLTPDTRAEIIVKKVGSAPEGYPELAEFLDFDNGLSVYRRFGWLHSRVLLQKQADISRIERYLRSSDTMNEGDKSRPNTMSDGRGKLKQDRNKLLAKAEEMLTQYDQFLLQAQELTQMESPSTRQYGNVLSFLWNHTPVVEADRENFFHRDDVITLRRGQPAPFLEMCFEKFFHRASVR
ncbi:MAG: hypothetical protein M1820_004308 [Bogoriella megaspora]|nr:MAG: hypothetical protein M1820_004308 [Bogoriella megaspora]